MVPDLIVLALDYYRTPLRFSHLADPEQALPKGLENLVDDIGSALSPQNIEAIAKVLGIQPVEIERAVHFFSAPCTLVCEARSLPGPRAVRERIRQSHSSALPTPHRDLPSGPIPGRFRARCGMYDANKRSLQCFEASSRTSEIRPTADL